MEPPCDETSEGGNRWYWESFDSKGKWQTIDLNALTSASPTNNNNDDPYFRTTAFTGKGARPPPPTTSDVRTSSPSAKERGNIYLLFKTVRWREEEYKGILHQKRGTSIGGEFRVRCVRNVSFDAGTDKDFRKWGGTHPPLSLDFKYPLPAKLLSTPFPRQN